MTSEMSEVSGSQVVREKLKSGLRSFHYINAVHPTYLNFS